MPPKIALIPTARMQTRAANKNSRPGLVDLSPSKRERSMAKKTDTPTTVDPAIRAAEEARALQRVVEMEDRNSLADEAFERRLHDPAPSKLKSE
jgi:hypothetical protein